MDSFIYECSKRSVALKRAGGLIENELRNVLRQNHSINHPTPIPAPIPFPSFLACSRNLSPIRSFLRNGKAQ